MCLLIETLPGWLPGWRVFICFTICVCVCVLTSILWGSTHLQCIYYLVLSTDIQAAEGLSAFQTSLLLRTINRSQEANNVCSPARFTYVTICRSNLKHNILNQKLSNMHVRVRDGVIVHVFVWWIYCPVMNYSILYYIFVTQAQWHAKSPLQPAILWCNVRDYTYIKMM